MNEMTYLYREGMAELRAENEQLKQRIAKLEAEIQEYRCLCEDWALVETDDSIKLAMIEASKPEVNNE